MSFEPIAIVGMGAVLPGCADLTEFWELVRSGRSAIAEVPEGRWPLPPARLAGGAAWRPDRVRSTRMALLATTPRPEPGLLSPALLQGLDPLCAVGLVAAQRAWRDAGSPDPRRAGVVLGNIVLPTEGTVRLAEAELLAPLARAAGRSWPVPVHDARDAFFVGLPAQLIAGDLGLRRGGMTLDAACASGLYALQLACEALHSGRVDTMLAGGLSRPDCCYTQMGFSALHALSPRGICAPFTPEADGLVVGEGAGFVVLRRLRDAQAAGDRIDAVIHGIGTANDRRGNLLQPASEGQLRAMQAAYRAAGWQPAALAYLECHATGTPTGDAVELASLRTLWQEAPARAGAVLGGVKAAIGHLLTAAGAAGLIKTVLALRHGELPPQPHSAPLDGPFRLLDRAEPWTGPRRAAVSAFGFGGIDAHVLLAAAPGGEAPQRRRGGAESGEGVHEGRPVEAIAVVGLGALLGEARGTEAVARALLLDEADDVGGAMAELALPRGRFAIPPAELPSILPQQLALLLACDEALRDGGDERGRAERLDCGLFAGIGFDLRATDFHLRWRLLDEEGVDADALAPALDAEKVLGHLGGIVASRAGRLLGIGGPCFTVGDEQGSGLAALEAAGDALRAGRIDRALVAAVEMGCEPRQAAARAALGDARPASDGACALLLMRLADAEAAGRRIYAVLEAGTAASQEAAPAVDRPELDLPGNGLIDLVDERRAADGLRCAATLPATCCAVEARCGSLGAAAGLFALWRAAAALHWRLLPGEAPWGLPEDAPVVDVETARPWLRDRRDGPRRALVDCLGLHGSRRAVLLQEHEATPVPARPLARWPLELTVFRGADRAALLAALDGAPGEVDGQAPALGAALLLDAPDDRAALLAELRTAVAAGRRCDGPRLFHDPAPPRGELAWVFPGSGGHAAGMGRALALRTPTVLARLDAENDFLASQFAGGAFWRRRPGPWLSQEHCDQNAVIFAQVSFATFIADCAAADCVAPQAVIGYSLGETKGMFATRTWRDRDLMYERIAASDLFRVQLGGRHQAARQVWSWPEDRPLRWRLGVIDADRATVEAALAGRDHVHLLIVNSATQCVIGGEEQAVQAAVRDLARPFHAVQGVTSVHCAVAAPVAEAYRALHRFPTTPPPGLRTYSGILGRSYAVDRESVADSILGQALAPFDYGALITQAWDDGVRFFVEMGPGASCTRMIRDILGERPHRALSLGSTGERAVADHLAGLARLAACGLAVRSPTVGGRNRRGAEGAQRIGEESILVPTARTYHVRMRQSSHDASQGRPRGNETTETSGGRLERERTTVPLTTAGSATAVAPGSSPLIALWHETQRTTIEAHGRYLDFIRSTTATMVAALDRLRTDPTAATARIASAVALPSSPHPSAPPLRSLRLGGSSPAGGLAGRADRPVPIEAGDRWPVDPPGTLHGYEDCMELAIGSVARVFGPAFAAVDALPRRVKLPDEPLMLCHRIVALEGEPLSMRPGRLVTEHDILPGAWYLDAGVIPTAICVEAGQADLVLSGWLGIDLHHGGGATYRLLDAQVTLLRSLPGPGTTIRYDIRILRFFQQAGAWFFHFEFDATVAGEPLMQMRAGCAGFFTAAMLDAGTGIVEGRLAAAERRRGTVDWQPPVPLRDDERYDDARLDALRRGDLVACFGAGFAGLPLDQVETIPGGRLRLVHRILAIEAAGGAYGAGRILGEADIHPDDWFIVCHFDDDPVMPGTLMYECCLHTLRVLLLRWGWIGAADSVVHEPIPGRTSSLACRGQVLGSTRNVQYRLDVVEAGFEADGTPYVLADALMSAEGRPVVRMTGMSLRLRGLTRAGLEALWAGRAAPAPFAPRPALYDDASITAFAAGKPSEAFGDRYRIFDAERRIARLPRDPYKFLDRIVAIENAEPWVLRACGPIVAEYDVPPDAWYFADGHGVMPFAVLLEVALQPCGWLAAYCGSALTSATDLRFRNLGGAAVQHRQILPEVGMLRTTVSMSAVSSSGGMIIQHYTMRVADAAGTVYEGTTYFGFFSAAALANQVGIRDATLYSPRPDAPGEGCAYPEGTPYAGPMLRMLDEVSHCDPQGGPNGLGFAEGRLQVDPAAWFFQAHFFEDPVCPGSLGLESFLQLLGVLAVRRWGAGRLEAMAAGRRHRWTYRGQVVPADRTVTVQAAVSAWDDERRIVTAAGWLIVDGRVIYGMEDFAVRLGG